MKKVLLLSLCLFACVARTKTTNKHSERWIDYDDLKNLEVGMEFTTIISSFGEPLYSEHIIDSIDVKTSYLIIYYNFKTKLYQDTAIYDNWDGVDLTKYTPVEKKFKPAKVRESGPPWGNKHILKLYFTNETDPINSSKSNDRLKYWQIITK